MKAVGKVLSEALEKYGPDGFSQGMRKSARELVEDVNMKQVGIGAALVAPPVAGALQESETVDFTSDTAKDAYRTIGVIGGTLAGALASHKAIKMAGRLTRNQPWKRTDVTKSFMEGMDNTLMPNVLAPEKKASFYAGQPLKAVLEEGYSASKRAVSRLVNPKESIAAKRTGLNKRQVELADDFDRLLKEESDAMRNMTYKKGQRGYVTELKGITDRIKQGIKVLHHKYINDFSNAGIFKDYYDLETPLADYARRFLTPTTYQNLVKDAGIPGNIGKEALTNMLKVQGFKTPVDKMKYLQLNTKGVKMGDMLRDIQWDPRSYKLFTKMQDVTDMTRKEVIKEMEEVFGRGAVKKLKGSSQKLQIIMSPKYKSNFDWGGSAGSLIWDPRKPGKMQFFGTDGRDLFGMKAGDDIINVSPFKEISIPEIKKIIEKADKTPNVVPVKRKRRTAKEYESMSDKEAKQVINRSRMISNEDYEALQKIPETYRKAYKDPITMKELAEFAGTRGALIAGGVGGFYGTYALADEILE